MQKKMFVCFAKPERQYKTFLNALVAWFTGGNFCHVAIVFEIPQENGYVKYVECSINRTSHPELDIVKLSEVENLEGWTCYRLQLEKPEYELEAYQYVNKHLVGKPYDRIGSIVDFTLCFCLPITYKDISKKSGDKTYCSRLAMQILQKAGQFLECSPEKVSPNKIYKLIVSSKDKTGKWTDVSQNAKAIFSQETRNIPLNYVYTESQEYSGILIL